MNHLYPPNLSSNPTFSYFKDADTAIMPKPRVLHIGDPIKYNHDIYARFASQFEIIRPSTEERARDAFKQALKERRWGDFDAIFRPFWNTGGEMGRWDEELISLLPSSVKIVASAGAGYDWVDVDVFARYGIPPSIPLSLMPQHLHILIQIR